MAMVTAADRELARGLVFAESLGGPLLVVSLGHAPGWWGVHDASGETVYGEASTDYDQACELWSVQPVALPHGPGSALVLPSPEQAAWVPIADGLLLVQWVGADSAAGLVAAARALGDEAFTPVGEWRHAGGAVLVFDSGADGRTLAGDTDTVVARAQLDPGRYAVATASWRGEVDNGGAVEDTMVEVVRLRWVGP